VDKFFVGMQVTILGMVVVLAILLLLYLCMVLMYRFLGPSEEKKRPESQPSPKPPEDHDAGRRVEKSKHHDPRVIAAITAAVLAACDADQPRVRALRLSKNFGRQWKALGRVQGLAGRKR